MPVETVNSIGGRLRELVDRVQSAHAASLVDEEGLTIDSYCDDSASVDFDSLSAELNMVLNRARSVVQHLEYGNIRELSLGTEEVTLLCHSLPDGYCLVLVLGAGAFIGQGHFYLKRAAYTLRAEL